MSHDGGEAPTVRSYCGGRSEKLNLRKLQTKIERKPYDYIPELFHIQSEFSSSLQLFQQQAVMKIFSISSDATTVNSDPTTVAEDLAESAMFLAQVSPSYPEPFSLADFPLRLVYLLNCFARFIPSMSRFKLARALTLLDNTQIDETLSLFMELQTLGDKKLTELASTHVFRSIWEISSNEHRTRKLHTLMFNMLQESKEAVAKRVLVTLWELYQRKVWFDEKTANAICFASFHPRMSIMTAALSSLLENKKPMIQNDKGRDDTDSGHESTESESEDHDDSDSNGDSPLNHLIDKQGFAERLFSRLQPFKEGSEVKMMMLKLTARVVGLHQLKLLKFYPDVQKYIQPHQQDVKNLLPAVIQAFHDKVPCDAVKPLFIQIVNQFVFDRSCQEAITIGLNAVKEICIRMPLLMNDDLLKDLDLLEKADSDAAQSLITIFQEVCPFYTKARPYACDEVDFSTDVPGDELLHNIDNDDKHESGGSNDSVCFSTDHEEEDDNDQEDDEMTIDDESLGTKTNTENSMRKRKFSDFSGESMAGNMVEEQREENLMI